MKYHSNIVIALLFFLFLGCSTNYQKESLVDRLDRLAIDSIIEKQIEKYSVPAIALGVFDADTILVFSHGVKGINNKIPIEPNDRYNIGSCTKGITSFLAARIIKKGYIKYETTIGKIFDNETININPYYIDKTLGDLLSHRAGIIPFKQEHEFQKIPDYILDRSQTNNRQLFSMWLLTLNPIIDNSQEFIYSNAGYSIAATMLEKVTRKPWEILVEEEVFQPLKMSGHFGWPHLYSPNQPRGHINLYEYNESAENRLIQFPDTSSYNIFLLEPGGDISLSINDYSIFLQEILKGLEGKGTLLSNKEYNNLLVSDFSYSNGWLKAKENNINYIGHEGSNGTFFAKALICKQRNFGMVVLSNSGDRKAIKAIQEITNRFKIELRN